MFIISSCHAVAKRSRRDIGMFAMCLLLAVPIRSYAGFSSGAGPDPDNRGGFSAKGSTDTLRAILELRDMAMRERDAKLKRELTKIADCLLDMWKKGRICDETAKKANDKAKASTLIDGLPTWKGDKMNINPDSFLPPFPRSPEPALSLLVAVLAHEGVHALQKKGNEKDAYQMERKILQRRLSARGVIPTVNDQAIKRRIQFVNWILKALCNKRLSDKQREQEIAKCRNAKPGTLGAGHSYRQVDGDSSQILVQHPSGAYVLQTPFAYTYDLVVAADRRPSCGCNGDVNRDGNSDFNDVGLLELCLTNPFSSRCIFFRGQSPFDVNCDGFFDANDVSAATCAAEGLDSNTCCVPPSSDLLIVAGAFDATSGGVVTYVDADGDGLADPATERFVAEIAEPISLAFVPQTDERASRLFVLDLASNSVFIVDGNPANGRPDAMNPNAFASQASFPELSEMVSLRPYGDGASVIASTSGAGTSVLDTDRVDYRLVDLDFDGSADESQPLGSQARIRTFVPAVTSDVQEADESLMATGAAGSVLAVYTTDEEATFRGEFLGERFVALSDHLSRVRIPLTRPLVAGEFVIVIDLETEASDRAGTLVEASRPEIVTTGEAQYLVGQEVRVLGRNFNDDAVVLVSGRPVETRVVSESELRFTASRAGADAGNFALIEVESNGALSNIASVSILPDCNANGVDDENDLAEGVLHDSNEDGLPDGCEVSPVQPPALVGPSTFISPLGQDCPLAAFTFRATEPLVLNAVEATYTGPGEVSIATFIDDGGGQHTVLLDPAPEPGEWLQLDLNVTGVGGGTSLLTFWVAHQPLDVNGDGATDIRDATAFGNEYRGERRSERIDMNCDGQVDVRDATAFGANWHGGWANTALPPRSVAARAAIGDNPTIATLAAKGTGFRAFADVDAGRLYVAEGMEEDVLARYGAEPVADGWMISRGSLSGVFQLFSLESLNVGAAIPAAAFGTLEDALCTAIQTSGTCVNMFDVETGEFRFSWKTPTGGLSYCTSSPGNTCDFIIASTDTHQTWSDRDCPEGGASAGQHDVQICEDNTE